MSVRQKVKRTLGISVTNLVGKLGFDIQKTDGLDTQIRKLRFITDLRSRKLAAEQLVREHPQHPKPHLELANCLHKLSDPSQFEQMDRYAEVWQEWLIRTGLAELGMEFVSQARVVGSLGNHHGLEFLLKANRCGLRSARKIFLLLPENVQLRNPALFSYFEPYLNVIRDSESIQVLKRLESRLTLPLGICIPLNDGCPYLDIASNLVEKEWEKQGFEPALFHLNDQHREMGAQALKKLGLPKDAWYVTLHVREPSYRGETPENTTENFRNANPLDYLKACEAVTRAGGWVFRMGDPSMTPLPPMPQMIDYALHEIRFDWMDVFLGATCQFCIGTSSGYIHIPMYFGKPILFTNNIGFVQYFNLTKRGSMFLPRWLKNIKTGELLSFEEFMSPPVSMLWSMKNFRDAGLHWVDNTPEELEAATIEMLELNDGDPSRRMPDYNLQSRFKNLAEACGIKHGGRAVKAFASISSDFLDRHVDLLGDFH